MRRIDQIYQFVEGKKVCIKTICFAVPTGTGQEYTGTVVAYYPNSNFEYFLELDTGELINTKYIVSIDILEKK